MEYVEAVRRNWLVALLVVLAVMVPTALVNVLAPPQYTASTKLWVGVGGGESITDLSQKVDVAATLMSTYPELVRSPLVLDPVIARLGLPTTAGRLAQRVVATVPNDTLVLSLQVTDADPVRAADTANAVAAQFGTVVERLPQVSAGSAQAVDTTVLQRAESPAGPSSPQIFRNMGVALVLSCVLAIIVCLLVARYLPHGVSGRRASGAVGAVPQWD